MDVHMRFSFRHAKPGFVFALVLALCAFGNPACGESPASPALSLSSFGIQTTVEELIQLERLNRSVRFDSAAAIAADWEKTYDRVTVVELPSVENRYALFEDEANRRADVAIRGTANFKNAVFDLEFLKSKSAVLGISLHSGFEKVAFALYADLRPRLIKDYIIRISGHSLGAAEAIIVGMLLQVDGFDVERVVASAPPKVTDAEGWSRFSGLPLVRMVGPFDPVPFLPPQKPFYEDHPYIQGGKLLLLLDGRKFTVLDPSFYDSLPAAARQAYADGKHFDAADHLLPKYLERLLPKGEGIEFVDAAAWEAYAQPAGRQQGPARP